MKLVKSEFIEFLSRLNVKGMIDECVFEEDGAVGAVVPSMEKGKVAGIIGAVLAQSSTFKGFGKKIGISNLQTLLKMVAALEAPDNTINAEVRGSELLLATRGGKFLFRLTDSDAIVMLDSEAAKAVTKMKADSPIKVALTLETINSLKKAASVLGATDKDAISFFVEDKKLIAVVQDSATKNSATVELASTDVNLKMDFEAGKLTKILEMADAKGFTLYLGPDQALIMESSDKDFTYTLSYIMGREQTEGGTAS